MSVFCRPGGGRVKNADINVRVARWAGYFAVLCALQVQGVGVRGRHRRQPPITAQSHRHLTWAQPIRAPAGTCERQNWFLFTET